MAKILEIEMKMPWLAIHPSRKRDCMGELLVIVIESTVSVLKCFDVVEFFQSPWFLLIPLMPQKVLDLMALR